MAIVPTCEGCIYDHGNVFTGECTSCCFNSKYTKNKAPTMWERIKDELNSFAEKWTLKFYTYIFGNNTYSIRFSYIASNGRRHGYSKIVNLNDVEDWLDFTNKIENEVVNKLGLNSVAYNIYISTRNPYYDPRVGDVAGMYPRFKFDTDDAEKTAKEFLNSAYRYNKISPIMDIASMYPYSDYIEDKDKSSAYPNTMQSFVMPPRSGKSIANLINEIMGDRMNRNKKLTIKNVIFNNPATIVMWSDGTKTVVKVQGKERFNKEKGLAMAISKKFFGNEGNYYEEFKKLIPELKKTENKSNKVVSENRKEEKSNEIIAEKLTGKEMLEDFIKHYPVYGTPGTIIKAVKVPNKNQILIRTKDGKKFHYDYETKKQIID